MREELNLQQLESEAEAAKVLRGPQKPDLKSLQKADNKAFEEIFDSFKSKDK